MKASVFAGAFVILKYAREVASGKFSVVKKEKGKIEWQIQS